MTTITSRPTTREECLKELRAEFEEELHGLIDKIDIFLEQRIADEFEELRDDLKKVLHS